MLHFSLWKENGEGRNVFLFFKKNFPRLFSSYIDDRLTNSVTRCMQHVSHPCKKKLDRFCRNIPLTFSLSRINRNIGQFRCKRNMYISLLVWCSFAFFLSSQIKLPVKVPKKDDSQSERSPQQLPYDDKLIKYSTFVVVVVVLLLFSLSIFSECCWFSVLTDNPTLISPWLSLDSLF